jgi:2-amino-4-hydroxy-6-hydroxymethyldihydropteridine diphosphokinase
VEIRVAGSVDAFIALGSNLGDRLPQLERARSALGGTAGIRVVAASRIYETEPVGPSGQGPYLNAVLAVETRLGGRPLLDRLLEIELSAGRDRSGEVERWSARTLDLDLLLYGDSCIDEPGLEVPHPRLHERGFVLAPLCELAGSRVHPRLGKSLETLRRERADSGWLRVFDQAGAGWGKPLSGEGRIPSNT